MNLRTLSRVLVVAAAILLSPAGLFAQPSSVSVLGSLQGHGTGVVQAGGILQHAAGLEGSGSQIGRFTLLIHETVNLGTLTGAGVFLLSFPNGDVIFGNVAGNGEPRDAHLTRVVEHLHILGGTGRFQDASGDLTVDSFSDNSTIPFYDGISGLLTGIINTPGK